MLKNYVFLMVLFLAGYAPAYWGAVRPLQRLMGVRYILAYAVTIAAGFFAPNIWLYQAVVVVMFLATTVDRQDAICRYVVMIALVPQVSTALVIGPLYLGTFQVTAAISIAMLIATAIKPNPGGTQPMRGWCVEDLAVLAVFLIFTVGATRSASFTALLRQMGMSIFDYLVPYYLVRRTVRTPEDMRRLLGCIAISAVSLAVIAIYESRTGWPLFEAIQARMSPSNGSAAGSMRRGNALRGMASLGHPLLFAYFLIFASMALLCSRRLFRSHMVWQGAIALLAGGLVVTQSRGALLAIVPAIMVLLACRRRFAAAAGVLAASGIGVAGLFALQHSSEAIAAFVGGNRVGKFYDYRGLLLQRGFQEGRKHPIFGQSFDTVVASLADITQGERIVDFVNSYLTMFLLGGIVGLGTFAICAAIAFRKLVARARRTAMLDTVRSNRAFLLSVMTGTYIYLYSASFVERMPVYVVVLLALSRLTSAELVRRVPKRPLVFPIETPADRDRFAERLVPA